MELKVKNLPAPITNFESYKEAGISLSEFKSFKELQAIASNSAFSIDYEIISFQVEGITHNHQYIEPLTVYGAAFENNHELMSQFNSASVGDKFIFSNIRAKATNGKEYEALPFSILLK
jgi:hypothetical protein